MPTWDKINDLACQIIGGLPECKIDRVERFLGFVKEENKKINLVSRTATDEDLIYKHLASSFLFVKWIMKTQERQDIKKVVDIGTGAGFPGLVCAICLDKINFTLIDSTQKKIDFLYDAISLLGLNNVSCLWGRAENFGKAKGLSNTFDIALSRAVGSLALTTQYASPFLNPDGIFITIKSCKQQDEVEVFSKNIKNQISLHKEDIAGSYIIMFHVKHLLF